MTKMTDEALGAALEEIRRAGGGSFGHRDRVTRIADHIAALTAERDTLATELREALEERLALRERVRALDAEKEQWRTSRFKAAQERHEAESRLAAIRQMAGDEDGLGLAYAKAYTPGGEGPHSKGLRGVARYILGDDATAHSGMTKEMEHIPEPDPLCSRCGGGGVDPRPRIEPTTAEAFATVRDGIRHEGGCMVAVGQACDCDRQNKLTTLSQLERRMGAMERSIRSVASHEDECRCADCSFANVFLFEPTNAPPVFTLEEVCKAMERTAIHAPSQRDVVAALTALRRMP